MATEVCRRTTREVKEALGRDENLLILDVRQPHDFDPSSATVAGSRRIEPDRIDAALSSLPRDASIVTFCS